MWETASEGILHTGGDRRPPRGFCALLVAVSILAVAFVRPSQAATIQLSDHSSDSTPASQLDASVDFTVVQTTLSVSVSNRTGGAAVFDISEIYFNSSDAVVDLAFTGGPGSCPGANCRWDFFASGNNTHAGGFGQYDWALISNHLDSSGIIAPGQTLGFDFDISGTGPFDMSDFGTDFSSIPPGNTPALVALKFVRCSGGACVEADDSAFGAAVPEPGTAALVLMGLGVLAVLNHERRFSNGGRRAGEPLPSGSYEPGRRRRGPT